MFKVVGFLALSSVLSVNAEKYSDDDYELMEDAYDYDYSDYDYGYDYNENVEQGFAEDEFETYEDDYDFSKFDALYESQEGNDDDIAYGWAASIGLFPYTVYLRITKSDGSVGICSGSIIGPSTVYTAHHCLDGSPTSITIEAGTLVGGQSSTTRQVRTMSRWIRRSQTNSLASTGYDFGFIYVNTPFTYTSAVYRVLLCGSTSSTRCGNSVLYSKVLYASGFGYQGASTTTIGTLRYASMYPQSDTACKNAGHSIGSQHLCTKGGSGNTCGGDSGGPLIIRSSDGRNDIQVGANSFSKTSCTDLNGNWDVFFEVSYGKAWYDSYVPSYYKTGVSWV